MEQDARQRGHDKGSTGRAIGANVRRAREFLGIDLAGLASRLSELGWPIAKSALSRLENGQRRVDVDDLMALAVALHASPLELLLGDADHPSEPTTIPAGLVHEELWAWASGEVELDVGELADWWRNQAAIAQNRIDGITAMEDAQPSALSGESAERTRRWLASEKAEAQQRLNHAAQRISKLAGTDETPGMVFDIPEDPTTAVYFGEHPEASER